MGELGTKIDLCKCQCENDYIPLVLRGIDFYFIKASKNRNILLEIQ